MGTELTKARTSSTGSLQYTVGTDPITMSPNVSQAKGWGAPEDMPSGTETREGPQL